MAHAIGPYKAYAPLAGNVDYLGLQLLPLFTRLSKSSRNNDRSFYSFLHAFSKYRGNLWGIYGYNRQIN
jgi:hypothetical protein